MRALSVTVDSPQKRVGTFLKRLRQGYGLTLVELGHRANMSYQYARQLESGYFAYLTRKTLERLANGYGVPFPEFEEIFERVRDGELDPEVAAETIIQLYAPNPVENRAEVAELVQRLVQERGYRSVAEALEAAVRCLAEKERVL